VGLAFNVRPLLREIASIEAAASQQLASDLLCAPGLDPVHHLTRLVGRCYNVQPAERNTKVDGSARARLTHPKITAAQQIRRS
jgi:hypothetical protein